MPGSATSRPSPEPSPGLAGGPVVRAGIVDSTQAIAFDLAARGAVDGTAVVAASQRQGRGRTGRTWHDEPGANLLVSLIVRPRLAPTEWPRLSLTTGVAVAETLEEVAGLPARLRWPNDVFVHGAKIAGVLLESRLGRAPVIVIGVGVNVNQRTFPAGLSRPATSILLATGRPLEVDAVLGAWLRRMALWRRRLGEEGFEPVRRRWRILSEDLGRPVRVDGEPAVAVDLDGDGALLVEQGGATRRVVSGVVEAGES